MEVIILYITASYFVHLGMILNEYDSLKQVSIIAKVSLLFAPISLLVIVGMLLSGKTTLNEKDL